MHITHVCFRSWVCFFWLFVITALPYARRRCEGRYLSSYDGIDMSALGGRKELFQHELSKWLSSLNRYIGAECHELLAYCDGSYQTQSASAAIVFIPRINDAVVEASEAERLNTISIKIYELNAQIHQDTVRLQRLQLQFKTRSSLLQSTYSSQVDRLGVYNNNTSSVVLEPKAGKIERKRLIGLYEKALKGKEKKIGADHTSTIRLGIFCSRSRCLLCV